MLTGFSITITGTPVGSPTIGPNTIVSTSSFQNGSVAPGDQVAIVGVNLGPADGVRADASTTLPTTLAGTSVNFNDTPVPIFYASDRLAVVHAPVNLSPGGTARVQVRTGSGTSTSAQVNVVAVKPGILTYEAGGVGQAKAINEDGTLNGDSSIDTAARGAPVGSVVAVYATGLGAVSPAIQTGVPAPATPLSTVVAPISATVGGRAARVTYAGAAPGLIGAYQVNVMVPVGTPPGNARVVLTADGNSSQNGVTILVR
jgi:uncharacterized protein (TIGR03437 family)